MKPLVYGAVLGVLWLVFGLPLAVPLLQPVILGFAAGVLAAPHVRRRGWTR